MTNSVIDQSLTLFQWNILGLEAKLPTLRLALAELRYEVVLLQETLLRSNISVANYNGFHMYHSQVGPRGLSILVQKDIYVEPPHIPNSCGPNVESPGITISLQDTKPQIYNIYHPPRNCLS